MKKLFSMLFFSLLLSGCDPDVSTNDVSARVSGKYIVRYYAINGDTLYADKKLNKLGVSEFYVLVDRKGSDSVTIGSTYKRPGDSGLITYVKYAAVTEANGTFLFSTSAASTQRYTSQIASGTFYERSLLGGPSLVVIPPSYVLKIPTDSTAAGVIITAIKQ